MSWCPKCKNEYEEGIHVCTDCGCELEEEPKQAAVPVYFGSTEEMEELKAFLEYSDVRSAAVVCEDAEDSCEVQVALQDKKQALRLVEIFLQQKAIESDKASAETQKKQEEQPGLYMNNAERAEENRSSAYTLLGVGGVGLVAMILGMAGVFPFIQGTSRYMIYGVLSALFILFIVMGALSMKSSKVFAKKAESENSLRSTIEKWCRDNLTGTVLDQEALGEEAEQPEEIKYFKRTELIKKKIQAQFMNLDMAFLERFTDEIYSDLFGE